MSQPDTACGTTAAAPREKRSLTSDQIQEILPHRFPFLLVDRIVDYEPGVFATGIKCVSVAEPVFCGHFPQEHVMPGVLLLEALAQVGAVALLSCPENRGKIAYFGGVKKCRFKRKVTPGDLVELHCRLTEQRGSVGFGQAVATVEGAVACSAELTFAIGS
ncbi:MAG: 3-hydroxyacyl-ACP dehydratase FabZ [Coriobacteriales bacterium]|jgi:3-hydroxyacyl-[acyl-carrier-protein] dehydratase|nr:3-hydroxyacyl-ACP dehydratase FabZ [Coriobacteriales bacterium]